MTQGATRRVRGLFPEGATSPVLRNGGAVPLAATSACAEPDYGLRAVRVVVPTDSKVTGWGHKMLPCSRMMRDTKLPAIVRLRTPELLAPAERDLHRRPKDDLPPFSIVVQELAESESRPLLSVG